MWAYVGAVNHNIRGIGIPQSLCIVFLTVYTPAPYLCKMLSRCSVDAYKSYMKVSVSVELPSVLVPDDLRSRLPLRHAQEDDLVAQHVFIVKVGRLRDLRALDIEIRRRENGMKVMRRG
jgi:hypothetical protein